ncbi:MAG: hypothetical protein ACFCGT_02675 [Sandaracinaceae bacterium]
MVAATRAVVEVASRGDAPFRLDRDAGLGFPSASLMTTPRSATAVAPNTFEVERHYYERVLNAHIHPLVRFFAHLGNERIAARYCHLHPRTSPRTIRDALAHQPRRFRWGGSDLLHVTDLEGERRMVVIETNSCPSGQKSMPLLNEADEQGGYRRLLQQAFLPRLAKRGLPGGCLAVLYDKNPMENSGYAAALADLTGETVYLTPFYDRPDPPARYDEQRVLHVRAEDGEWLPVRAAFRYVTQRPWNRIPPVSRTLIFNPVSVCLAGGRNKLLAAKAYDFHNARLEGSGLHIDTPETLWDVTFGEIPLWVERMGGLAVVKVPYSNAGQGIYTLTRPSELEALMAEEPAYDRFIVQQLIGNAAWSSRTERGALYHVGTVPDRQGRLYVADLRMMVGAGADGFFPLAIYARRAREPLTETPPEDSWGVLGTNLSKRQEDGTFTTQSERLMLMDARDFNRLGIGLDDLIDAYVQTVLAVTAIDELAGRLVTTKARFSRRLFRSLNPDSALVDEIVRS